MLFTISKLLDVFFLYLLLQIVAIITDTHY